MQTCTTGVRRESTSSKRGITCLSLPERNRGEYGVFRFTCGGRADTGEILLIYRAIFSRRGERLHAIEDGSLRRTTVVTLFNCLLCPPPVATNGEEAKKQCLCSYVLLSLALMTIHVSLSRHKLEREREGYRGGSSLSQGSMSKCKIILTVEFSAVKIRDRD